MVHDISGMTGSRFRSYMEKLARLCERSPWTPLHRAEKIMHRQMHELHQVCVELGLSPDFEERNAHLQTVPYTDEELRWAAKNGLVLTLHTSSVRRLSLLSGQRLEVSREIWKNCPDVSARAPRRASWHLALRQTTQKEEVRILCRQPKTLRMRMRLAEVGIAATAAYLDSVIYGIVPSELRMTESVVHNDFGLRRVFVGGPCHGRGAKIQVIAGHSYALYPPAVVWKPHPVPHL